MYTYNGLGDAPKFALSSRGIQAPTFAWFLRDTWIHTTDDIFISLGVLAQLMVVTNMHRPGT